jgi:hypothetical protein
MATDNEFWVIFDTSQFRGYYKDVHNLLAMPRGATMRYNYEVGLLTKAAREFVAVPIRPILFVYAQRQTEYHRVNGKSDPHDPNADYVYIPTRLGRMLKVVTLGDNYHFDFAVDGYPITNPAFRGIMGDLKAKAEVPLGKYVCISDMHKGFQGVTAAEDQGAWAQIVELLGTPPMQFAQDAFWRLVGPFAKGDKLQEPEVRDGVATYHAAEFQSYKFQLITDSGKLAVEKGLDFEVEAESSDTVLTPQGSGKYPVRHYHYEDIAYGTGGPPAFFIGKGVELHLSTLPKENWPSGPDLSLRYIVSRNRIMFTLGVILALVGVFLIALGFVGRPFNHYPWNPFADIALGVAGIALLGFGLWPVTGKFGLRSPV